MPMDRPDTAPATRGDLKMLEANTKADLKEFRQEFKSDIAGLKDGYRTLAIEVVKTNGRIERLEENFTAKLNEGVSKVLSVVDGFMAQTQKVDRDQIITHYRMDELEKRVKTLEAH